MNCYYCTQSTYVYKRTDKHSTALFPWVVGVNLRAHLNNSGVFGALPGWWYLKKKNKKQNKWDEKNKTLVLSWRVNLWKGWNNWMTTLSSRGLNSKWNFVWLFYPSWWLGMKSMCDQTFSKKLALLRKRSLNHREQDEWNSIGSI